MSDALGHEWRGGGEDAPYCRLCGTSEEMDAAKEPCEGVRKPEPSPAQLGPRIVLAEPSIEVEPSAFSRVVGLSFRVRGVSLACVRQVLMTEKFYADSLTFLVEETAFVLPPELRDLPSSAPERGVFLTQCAVAMAGHKALTAMLAAKNVVNPDVVASCLLPESLEAHLILTLRSTKFMAWLTKWALAPEHEGKSFSEFRRLVCLVAEYVQSSAPDLVGAYRVDWATFDVVVS